LLTENFSVFGVETLGLLCGSKTNGCAKRFIVGVGDRIEFFNKNLVFSHEVFVLIFYTD
jgi:hypothetical protein